MFGFSTSIKMLKCEGQDDDAEVPHMAFLLYVPWTKLLHSHEMFSSACKCAFDKIVFVSIAVLCKDKVDLLAVL